MTWKDSYAVGIPAIDKQHKELCDIVDQLYAASASGKSAQEALKTLQFLESYTLRHFADEERLQLSSGYPKYQQHKAMHTDFISQVTKLKKDMEATGVTIPLIISINQVISNWLINHILKVDRELKDYVK
ncbi:Bacteriohemerythrin [bioreactor metagenome]|uniref:Bacteriohemerythrin n=1 Tax=bioreactor metagenome TaxID=1076179 RepID=A0A645D1B9_9ZZZZ